MLGDIANRAGQHHHNRTMMAVYPVTVIYHAVDAVTEAALGSRTDPDPAPLWRVVVRTAMRLNVVPPAPAVLVSSKGANVVG